MGLNLCWPRPIGASGREPVRHNCKLWARPQARAVCIHGVGSAYRRMLVPATPSIGRLAIEFMHLLGAGCV